VTTYPLFVPAGPDHVAAVVSAPDGEEPRGLVVVLAGTGRHNVIGSTLAARLAARLTSAGLACVRLDYAGVGDSPGAVAEWTPSDVEAATRQARAAVREAGAALGVTRFAGVGTCYGSRVALQLLDDPRCAGAVCLAPPVVEQAAWSRAGRSLAAGRMYSLARRARAVRQLARPLVRRLRRSAPSARAIEALGHLERVPLVFLYGKDGFDDHYGPEVGRAIEAQVTALSPAAQARFTLRFLDEGPLTTFDGLALEDQSRVVDAVVPYVLGCFAPDAGRLRGAAR
jgi:alpha/beta superfamily hydrolase